MTTVYQQQLQKVQHPRMYLSLTTLASLAVLSAAWSISTSHAFISSSLPSNKVVAHRPPSNTINTALNGGTGVANTYSWNEEQFEIEVKINVPPRTSAKDIKFKCSSESIDLRLLNNNNANNEDDNDGNTNMKDDNEKVLLDGTRKTRGKICVDGTFWSIEGNPDKERQISITIEKSFIPISSSEGTQTFETITEFDWGGLYPNDEEEVSSRKYDEAEELNVREYAAKLGVDIDNIDMR